MSDRTCYIVWPSDLVEEIDDEGDATDAVTLPGIYSELIVAGLPVAGGPKGDHWADIIDFSVYADDTAIAYTVPLIGGRAEHEIPAGAVQSFLDRWNSDRAQR